MRDDESPSFYNPLECIKVVAIVEKLLNSNAVTITTNDIGIITPFYRQVRKIRQLLRSKRLGSVRVGSVEDYQGQEEKIVIISTVRSNDQWLSLDYKQKLGLFNHSKRFNVAITRAKNLLIVVGNPIIMQKDKYWKQLLDLCWKNSAYKGCKFSYRDEATETSESQKLEEVADWALLGGGALSATDMNMLYDDTEWRVTL